LRRAVGLIDTELVSDRVLVENIGQALDLARRRREERHA